MTARPSATAISGHRPARVAAIILAAGRGTRARIADAPDALPKQYRRLAGRPVIARTITAFLAHPRVSAVVVVIDPADAESYRRATAGLDGERLLAPVTGGADRQASSLAGLLALRQPAPDLVLIHDAVRPLVSGAMIDAAIDALAQEVAVVVGVPVVDTVKRTDPAGHVVETVPRERLWRAATPQGFRYADILDAHERAASGGVTGLTDDGAVAALAGHRVRMIAIDEGNMKLTTADDFATAEARLAAEAMLQRPDVRTGIGYDVHVLEPGEAVVLGGVSIPHTHRLRGHSDADVALHALTDAILGAIGDGDIGQHFPPSDPRWRGAASTVFLEDAVRRVRERGGVIANADITVIAEAPRIGPHRDAMRATIATACGVPVDRIGVKATTSEGLGFTGRREGIAAMAIATVRLPFTGDPE